MRPMNLLNFSGKVEPKLQLLPTFPSPDRTTGPFSSSVNPPACNLILLHRSKGSPGPAGERDFTSRERQKEVSLWIDPEARRCQRKTGSWRSPTLSPEQ